MARRVRRLTPTLLRRMVLEEKSRFERTRRRSRIRETSDPVEAGIEDPEKVKADEVEPEAEKPKTKPPLGGPAGEHGA